MNTIRKFTDTIPVYLIYSLALFLPLIFTPITTEFYETAKLIFLVAVVLLMLFFWSLKVFTENKISLTKTPLDLLLLLFLGVAFLSTIFSPTPYVAFFGLLPKVSGSLIFLTAVVLLYFIVVSSVRGLRDIRVVSQLLIFSGTALSLVSLLSYFKIYLPWQAANFQTFSLAGSPQAAALYLTMLLPIALSLVLMERDFKNPTLSAVFGVVSTLIFSITIILIGNLSLWIGASLAVALTLLFHLRSEKLNLQTSILLFVIFAIVGTVATLAYTPTLKDKTPIGAFSSSFQKEIQLPFIFSWKISAGAFRDSPILGTGPATYLYNFTEYKPLEILRTDLWDKRINSAYNQYLQTLAEMGGAGVIILILLAVSFIFLALRNKDREGLALAGITFLILMALSPMTVLTQASGFLIIALFIAGLRDRHSEVRLMEARLSTDLAIHPLLPAVLFIPILALILASGYFTGKLALGEYYHRLALNSAVSSKSLDSYNQLIQAEKVNPQVDLYRVELAQTSFALANAIASQKGPASQRGEPAETSPSGSLTEADRKNIQILLQQSIAEGRAAVALSPRSAANWEILAGLYKQLSGVAQNSLQFSLDAYGRAIRLDPLNPLLRLAVGGVYYQAKNYDLAVRFFDDAVALKSDYSNGLYNLAIALREKGNLSEAVTVTERLIANLQDKPDSADYELATNLLSELKSKAPSDTQPPAATASAALEKENLPGIDVSELQNPPEEIATPPAIQR